MRMRFAKILAVAVFIAALAFTTTSVMAQLQGRVVKLPPFRLMQATGKLFRAEDLPVGKPILLIYFSPDCEHCETFMNRFFKQPDNFKKASVVMVTYLPVEKVVQFSNTYNVQRFPNLYVGTEGMSFFVRNYYHLVEMPFAALHDKNGNLLESYTRNIPLDKLGATLKNLK